MIDVNNPMHIVPPNSNGRRRAILIGINYVGQQGQLSGCHNDLHNIKNYLVNAQGFRTSDMLVLMDDGRNHPPSKRNIEDAFKRVTEYSQAGDVVFIHYSGTLFSGVEMIEPLPRLKVELDFSFFLLPILTHTIVS